MVQIYFIAAWLFFCILTCYEVVESFSIVSLFLEVFMYSHGLFGLGCSYHDAIIDLPIQYLTCSSKTASPNSGNQSYCFPASFFLVQAATGKQPLSSVCMAVAPVAQKGGCITICVSCIATPSTVDIASNILIL